MRLGLILIFVFISLSNASKAETVFYCQTELATGFVNKNGIWQEAFFQKPRYTIKFDSDYSQLNGLDDYGPFKCSVPYSLHPESKVCVSSFSNGETFIFNKKTKRFFYLIPSSAGGYTADGTDTDTMYAGTCTNF